MVVVVPFRSGGKTRLPRSLRRELALAMLGDVVEAAAAVGEARVVTADVEGADLARSLGASVAADPGGGLGAAVAEALRDADGPCLVVNADLPLATPSALRRLVEAGRSLVAAQDGTTNALSLARAEEFVPAYGPGSARRFVAAGLRRMSIPELEHDVDTVEDLRRVASLPYPLGSRTTVVVNHHKVPTAAR